MGSQTKTKSLCETIVNVGSGFIVNWTASFAIFPMFGYPSTLTDNTLIALVYTGLAIARTYLVRRFFNRRNAV